MIELDNSTHEIMTDLMIVVLIIFMLIVVALSLDVHNKINIISKDNTFSGGKNQPILVVSPVKYKTREEIAIYPQSVFYSEDKKASVMAISPTSFINLLSFIDYGEIIDNDRTLPLINISLYGTGTNININYFNAETRETGVLKPDILKGLLKHVWPGYEFGQTPANYFFKVTKRARVFFESDDVDGKKSIVIGHYAIDISDSGPENLFILNTLATAITDFIYIGEYNFAERLNVLKEVEGEEAALYYNNWGTNESETIEAPFVKYVDAKKQFIEDRTRQNLTPPPWVEDFFLDKIGANLKIISTKKTFASGHPVELDKKRTETKRSYVSKPFEKVAREDG